MSAITLRPITLADVPAMSRNVAEGLASYAAWAPPGWEPNPAVSAEADIRDRVTGPGFTGHITEDGRAHVAAYPAADEPGAHHLFHLFVTPALQGTGIAAVLHDRILEDARVAGSTVIRLRTPFGNARGIRFYEREGWVQAGTAGVAPHLGLECVWMRREL